MSTRSGEPWVSWRLVSAILWHQAHSFQCLSKQQGIGLKSLLDLTSKASPLVAYVAPFALFMILGSLESQPAIADIYPWFYSFKILAVLGLCVIFRKHYPEWSSRHMVLGILAGAIGIALWIGLSELRLEAQIQAYLPAWLAPKRVGYDPFTTLGNPAAQWSFIASRLLGLAIVVPLMEEIFWRGFLLRYLVAENFEEVPTGRYTRFSFVVVTLLFTAAHTEWLAAFVWGAGINLLLYRTQNLWACVVAHMTSNLLLGIYVLATGTWYLW